MTKTNEIRATQLQNVREWVLNKAKTCPDFVLYKNNHEDDRFDQKAETLDFDTREVFFFRINEFDDYYIEVTDDGYIEIYPCMLYFNVFHNGSVIGRLRGDSKHGAVDGPIQVTKTEYLDKIIRINGVVLPD